MPEDESGLGAELLWSNERNFPTRNTGSAYILCLNWSITDGKLDTGYDTWEVYFQAQKKIVMETKLVPCRLMYGAYERKATQHLQQHDIELPEIA